MSESNSLRSESTPLRSSWKETFLLQKLPFVIVLALILLGVAYTSMSHKPLVGYWEFVALVTAVVCITTGWPDTYDRQARVRLVWSQAAHWAAILVAMNIVLLPDVQGMLTSPATGMAILLLLALGTFLAGIHISWQLCVLGTIMAVTVPAIAWLKQSSLFLVLAGAAVIGLALAFYRRQ
jgi:hypothetical protein